MASDHRPQLPGCRNTAVKPPGSPSGVHGARPKRTPPAAGEARVLVYQPDGVERGRKTSSVDEQWVQEPAELSQLVGSAP
jgi:hypothetical protein